MRTLVYAVLVALSTTACADALAGGADVSTPTAVVEAAALGAAADSAGTAEDDECPAGVAVKRVPPVRGVGYTWVRAEYDGGNQAIVPTWEVTAPADIRAYNEDEFYAYIAAPTGTYTVRATGPCGVFGEVKIDHVITLP